MFHVPVRLDDERAHAEGADAMVDDPVLRLEDAAAGCDDHAGVRVAGETACHAYALSAPKPKSSRRFASVYMSFESSTTAISETPPRVADATRHGPDLWV